MNNQFDKLAKGLAQSVTRRAALKEFGLGLTGLALACLGLANKADAAPTCLPRGTACTASNGGRRVYPGCNKCCNGYVCWGLDVASCYCE